MTRERLFYNRSPQVYNRDNQSKSEVTRVPPQMSHVSLVSHEPLVAVVAAEGEVAGVSALVTN